MVCTLLFCIQQPVTCAVTIFPNEQQNIEPECADTEVRIEGRKVEQRGFHFSELRSLQCTVMCFHMQSLKVFSNSALL